MVDWLKKGLYTGLGLVNMSKDAIENAAEKLKKELELSQEEGEKIAKEMQSKSEEAKKNLQAAVDNAVEKSLSSLKLAKMSEVEELKKKIDKLEKELEEKNKK